MLALMVLSVDGLFVSVWLTWQKLKKLPIINWCNLVCVMVKNLEVTRPVTMKADFVISDKKIVYNLKPV